MLGNLLQSFAVNYRELLARVVLGIVIIGVSLFIAANFFLYDFSLTLLNIFGTIMCALLSLGGFWLISTVTQTLWNMPRVDIHEGGVKLRARRREQAWLWEDIRRIKGSVTQGMPITMMGVYSFSDDHAELFELDNRTANLFQVYDLITVQVNERLLPSYRQRLAQGEIIDFGEFKLSTQAVIQAKQQIVMSEIAGSVLVKGALVIQSHQQKAIVLSMLEHVVNPLLFMQLLHELTTSEVKT